MSLARQLFELQEMDDEIGKRRQALEQVEAWLADNLVVEEARAQVEQTDRDLDAVRRDQRDLELQVQSFDEKVRELERKLYGGRVTNPKELLGFQEDLRGFQQRKAALEDRLLELMLRLEEHQGRLADLRKTLGDAEKQREAEVARLTQEREALRAELAALEQRSSSLRALLNGQDLQLYETLKTSRNGLAIARVERGICRGCGLALPSQELQRVRTTRELVRCKSCGRILYSA